ncbi:MAG: hypothetical protein AAF597_15875, partial [Bacteroidota bacterium]
MSLPKLHGLGLLCLLLLSSGRIGAQQFAPPGAEWCLQSYDVDGTPLGYVVARYDRDTLVRGRAMKVLTLKVRRSTPYGLRDVPGRPVDLLRQSADSIFYYIPNIGIDVFLFKESYEVGEETLTYLYNDPFDVLTVEEETFNGTVLPVASLNLAPQV